MALVDYSSSSSASTESLHQQPPAKRRKAGDSETSTLSHPSSRAVKVDGQDGKPTKRSVMPPLPSTFHDLYASTVRQSVVDDPSLHHGRKRQTPHIVGNWPSHLYIECAFIYYLFTRDHRHTELIRDHQGISQVLNTTCSSN